MNKLDIVSSYKESRLFTRLANRKETANPPKIIINI